MSIPGSRPAPSSHVYDYAMVTPASIFREGIRRGESHRYRLFGAGREEDGEQGRRPGRLLAAFKAFAMLLLVGMLFFVLAAAVRLVRTEAPPKSVAADETAPG
jgi:hypothetical protein